MLHHVTTTSLRVIALKAAEQIVRSKYGRQSTIFFVQKTSLPLVHCGLIRQSRCKKAQKPDPGGSQGAHSLQSLILGQATTWRSRRESRTCPTRLASLASLVSRFPGDWKYMEIWGIQKVATAATATRSSNLWRVST